MCSQQGHHVYNYYIPPLVSHYGSHHQHHFPCYNCLSPFQHPQMASSFSSVPFSRPENDGNYFLEIVFDFFPLSSSCSIIEPVTVHEISNYSIILSEDRKQLKNISLCNRYDIESPH